jgi:NAD(P)-dependent dehydrogenase (short-subunit alcohol dehydrogenase family)
VSDECLPVRHPAPRLAKQISDKVEYITILFNNAWSVTLYTPVHSSLSQWFSIIQGAFSQPSATTADAFVHAYLDTVKPEHFGNVLRTNAVGPYWMTFAFLPLLEKWRLAGENGHTPAQRFPPQVVMTSSMNGWTKVRDRDPLKILCRRFIVVLSRIPRLAERASHTFSRRVRSDMRWPL